MGKSIVVGLALAALVACGGSRARSSATSDASTPDAAPPCEATSCGGDCADLANDSRHCGSCGSDCGGGGCVAGACQRVVEVAPVHSQTPIVDRYGFLPEALAVSDRDVVWAEQGKVSRCAKWGCGGKASTVAGWADSLGTDIFGAVAADDANVYWGAFPRHGGFSGILFCPLGGCSAPLVFATDYGLAPVGASPGPIQIRRGNVYFDGLVCPSSGCDGGAAASHLGGGPYDKQTMGPSDLYWTTWTAQPPVQYSVVTCPLSGCAGAPRTVVDPLVAPDALAADATNVYWIESAAYPALVRRILMCPISGCASPTVVAADQPRPTSLATDGVNVYWTNLGTLDTAVDGGAPPQPGAVMMCPIAGCGSAPTVAAESPTGASNVVLDAKSFYWVRWDHPNGGAIMKSAK